MKSSSLDQPEPLTVQAEIDDTVLIRLAQNITEVEIPSDISDINGDAVKGYEYDETVLQIPTSELPFVTSNLEAYFKIGLALEADFDGPTLLWYHTLTNFLELKQTLVSINPEDGSIEFPVPPEPTETIFVEKVLKEAALSTVTAKPFDIKPVPIDLKPVPITILEE